MKILDVQWFSDIGIVTIDNGYEIKTYIKKSSWARRKERYRKHYCLGAKSLSFAVGKGIKFL